MVKIQLEENEFTKYEKARVLGSRALQISMGAPLLVKLTEDELKQLKYNPVEIAKIEFEKGVIPMQVKRLRPHER